MKRIVICMDGTWQTLRQDRPTNIALIARSVAHKETIVLPDGAERHIHQTVIYTHGVGSNVGAVPRRGFSQFLASFNRINGGAFGEGLEDGIVDAYLRLCFNYEEGDEIYIFGFSRGAFAARRLSGLINTAGILSRLHVDKAWDAYTLYHSAPTDGASPEKHAEHEAAARQFRSLYGKGGRGADGTRTKDVAPPPIAFLGVFDTVVQRGIGQVLGSLSRWGRRRYRFRNQRISSNVLAARHAVAVDERRLAFPPTLWDELDASNAEARARAGADPSRLYYEQRWFIGAHGDVGGGDGSKLSALSLKWMTEGAAEAGLRFYATYGDDRSPAAELIEGAGLAYDAPISQPPWWKSLLYPVHYMGAQRRVWRERRKRPESQHLGYYFDRSVLMRASAEHVRPRYKPGAIRPFQKLLKEWKKHNPLD